MNTEERRKYNRERQAAFRLRNPEYKRTKYSLETTRWWQKKCDLKRRFGITLEEYADLFELQKGVCAICGGADIKLLAVDHDHETGEVRGLLCQNCNMGLGLFQDDPDLLARASDYLEAWPT